MARGGGTTKRRERELLAVRLLGVALAGAVDRAAVAREDLLQRCAVLATTSAISSAVGGVSAEIDPAFIEGEPEESYANAALSLLLPYLEPYLIRSMRAAKPHVKDPTFRIRGSDALG